MVVNSTSRCNLHLYSKCIVNNKVCYMKSVILIWLNTLPIDAEHPNKVKNRNTQCIEVYTMDDEMC